MPYHNPNIYVTTTTTTTPTAKVKLITDVKIEASLMRSTSNSRSILVVGDREAVFGLQVTRSSDGRFYNFDTKTFEATITPQSRLKNQNPGSFSIVFPAAASGDTYDIIVWPEPHFNTELSYGKNKFRSLSTVYQAANAEITFKTDASISTVSETDIDTSTGSLIDKYTNAGRPSVVMGDLKLTVATALGNHGVFITTPGVTNNVGEWDANALYWETVATDHETTSASTHDAGSTSTALVLNNVNGLHIGMHVAHIETVGALATMPTITAIDIDTLTVTLSAAQTWAITKDITFRAYGIDLIKKAISISLSLKNATCRLGQESTTIRTAVTSGYPVVVDVKGTGGISKGATVRGKFVDNSGLTTGGATASACVISAVSGSTTAGTVTITNGRYDGTTNDIQVNTILYVDGSSADIYLSGEILISKYPLADQDIFVDISKIFTIGTAS